MSSPAPATATGGRPADAVAAVLHGPGDLRQEHRPPGRPGPGEVLLEVGVVGICGSDLHYFQYGRSGSSVVEHPVVIGHEFGGRIVAVGAGVDGARVGHRVSVEPGVPCRTCEACRAGEYNHCRDMHFYGAAPHDGAMQQYLVVAADAAHPVPDALSDGAAAMIEPLSVALWAVTRAGIGAGTRVLITGAGPIGLLVAQVARARGAAAITVLEPTAHRREIARRWADHALPPGEPVPLADVLVECSGTSQALSSAAASVSRGGRIVLVGVGSPTLSLPMDLVQEGEITVTGSHRYRHTWPEAIELAATGQVDLDGLITHRYPLAELHRALARPDPGTIKAVVVICPPPTLPTDRAGS